MRGNNEQESACGVVDCFCHGQASVAGLFSLQQSEEVHTASALRLSGSQKLIEDRLPGRGRSLGGLPVADRSDWPARVASLSPAAKTSAAFDPKRARKTRAGRNGSRAIGT